MLCFSGALIHLLDWAYALATLIFMMWPFDLQKRFILESESF